MTGNLQLAARSTGLVRHFRDVAQTRIDGVPIVNPATGVDALGFAHTADGCLGVLIAPWLIDRILLRREGGDWRDRPPGSIQGHRFASGDCRFRYAGEHPIGRYPACSLLSPLLENPDRQSAVALGTAALHDSEQQGTDSQPRSAEIERRGSGADPAGPAARNTVTAGSPLAPAPLSRRACPVGPAHAESGGPG